MDCSIVSNCSQLVRIRTFTFTSIHKPVQIAVESGRVELTLTLVKIHQLINHKFGLQQSDGILATLTLLKTIHYKGY